MSIMPLLSVIIPAYNEEVVLTPCYQRLTAVLSQLSGFDYELLFVNDGSRDTTLLLLSI